MRFFKIQKSWKTKDRTSTGEYCNRALRVRGMMLIHSGHRLLFWPRRSILLLKAIFFHDTTNGPKTRGTTSRAPWMIHSGHRLLFSPRSILVASCSFFILSSHSFHDTTNGTICLPPLLASHYPRALQVGGICPRNTTGPGRPWIRGIPFWPRCIFWVHILFPKLLCLLSRYDK
jgi:hypothetical protein